MPALPKKEPHYIPVPATTFKARLVGGLISSLMKLWGRTLRITIVDPSAVLSGPGDGFPHGLLWTFWHNRIFLIPIIYRRFARAPLGGASVLTSPSGDGALLSAVMKGFGLRSVRGSSNKRAAQALVECRRRLREGQYLGITPDGPRGPLYVVAPGVIQLSRLTGAPILPIHVHMEEKWELRSWDRFQLPVPFSKVTVTLGPPLTLPQPELEDARQALEGILRAAAGEKMEPPPPGTPAPLA